MFSLCTNPWLSLKYHLCTFCVHEHFSTYPCGPYSIFDTCMHVKPLYDAVIVCTDIPMCPLISNCVQRCESVCTYIQLYVHISHCVHMYHIVCTYITLCVQLSHSVCIYHIVWIHIKLCTQISHSVYIYHTASWQLLHGSIVVRA